MSLIITDMFVGERRSSWTAPLLQQIFRLMTFMGTRHVRSTHTHLIKLLYVCACLEQDFCYSKAVRAICCCVQR
jgi:hypothetical protein